MLYNDASWCPPNSKLHARTDYYKLVFDYLEGGMKFRNHIGWNTIFLSADFQTWFRVESSDCQTWFRVENKEKIQCPTYSILCTSKWHSIVLEKCFGRL